MAVHFRRLVCFVYLGTRTFMSKPAVQGATVSGNGLLPAYFSALVLTLGNPMTILSFAAVFAGLGLASVPDYLAASALVGGVFLGSALWWLLLSYGVSLFRSRINSTWMRIVNQLSGGVIFAFGLYALSRQLFR